MKAIQELWPDWWKEPEFDRVIGEHFEQLVVDGPSKLNGKERRNLIRSAVEHGAVIALTKGVKS
jgi:hypothetical protein